MTDPQQAGAQRGTLFCSVGAAADCTWRGSAAARWSGPLLVVTLLWLAAALTDAETLLYRPLWMDEVHTWLLATDADCEHALRALADGVDYNPPGVFLLARVVQWFPAESQELLLRALSAVLLLSAVLAMYLVVAPQCGTPACMTAVLAAAGHSLLVHQATELRFYGTWAAAVAWLCWLLQVSAAGSRGSGWLRAAALSLAALTCMCHYFGIVSLVLLLVPLWPVYRHAPAARRLLVLLLLTGMVTTGLCSPYLSGQRAALTRPTWISAPTLRSSLEFLADVFPVWGLLLVGSLWRNRPAAGQEVGAGWRQVARTVLRIPGGGLLLLPPGLVAFAWCVQPALVPRYAIVSLLGCVPLIAVLTDRLPRRQQWLLCAGMWLLAVGSAHRCVQDWQRYAEEQQRLLAAVDAAPADTLFVFEDRTIWLPVVQRRPDLRARCVLADFEDEHMVRDCSLRAVQRDVGRRIATWYPEFRLRHIRDLASCPQFRVVPYRGGSDQDLRYPPGFQRTPCGDGLYRFERQVATVSAAGASGLWRAPGM